MNMNDRTRPARYLSGCGCLTLIASAILFFTNLMIFQGWMSGSPPWQARLYGIQTQGVVKSINADACNTNSPDPNLDPSLMNGVFVLGSLPRVKIEQNVLPTIQFSDRQGHRYVVPETFCGDYGVGEQVTVWYLPATPTTFALAYETDSDVGLVYGSIIGMLVSLPFLLASVVLLVIGAVRGWRAARRGSVYSAGSPWEAGVSPGAASTYPWENR